VEDSSGRGNSNGDGAEEFRILDVDEHLEIVERAAAKLLWPEMEEAAMATRRERVGLIV